MANWDDVAKLIFPNIHDSIEEMENRYPERKLNEGAIVTRFAPSPTGYLHTGSLFATLVEYRMAKQTDGIFFLRVEDTDKKREIEDSINLLTEQLKEFGIIPDEGVLGNNTEIGNYGPYTQSKREDIYKVFIKHLISEGKAYPCFCSSDDLTAMREKQEKSSVRPGYYGVYSKCSVLTPDEVISKIENNEKYIIRFRSNGHHLNKIVIRDSIRGNLELSENDQHIVLMKSDNLPTYHLAHVIDDHLMRTTNVIRGEEWVPSTPIHIELFNSFGWKAPIYAHLPTIMIQDGTSKRKLSKRKDKEAAVSYFLEKGYMANGIIEYLLGVVNSDYEPWRRENLDRDMYDFNIRLEKMNLAGALFDTSKLDDVCKELISRMSKEEVTEKSYIWATEYSEDLKKVIDSDRVYYTNILGIERGTVKPRKDFVTWGDLLGNIDFFYDDMFDKLTENGYIWSEKISPEDIPLAIDKYIENYDMDVDKETWFDNMKEIASDCNFCPNSKEYKLNPDMYVGSIGDFAEIIRIALTNRKQTPDMYAIMQVMGEKRVIDRLNKAKESLK